MLAPFFLAENYFHFLTSNLFSYWLIFRSDSHDKPQTSGKIGAFKFSKVVEDIVCRIKKLEGDLMR